MALFALGGRSKSPHKVKPDIFLRTVNNIKNPDLAKLVMKTGKNCVISKTAQK